MDWCEIDLEARTWTLPTERAKNDEAYVVPLSPLALDQLRAMLPKREGLVFTTTGKTPVSGFSRAKRTLAEQMLRIMTDRIGRSSAEMSPPVVRFVWDDDRADHSIALVGKETAVIPPIIPRHLELLPTGFVLEIDFVERTAPEPAPGCL